MTTTKGGSGGGKVIGLDHFKLRRSTNTIRQHAEADRELRKLLDESYEAWREAMGSDLDQLNESLLQLAWDIGLETSITVGDVPQLSQEVAGLSRAEWQHRCFLRARVFEFLADSMREEMYSEVKRSALEVEWHAYQKANGPKPVKKASKTKTKAKSKTKTKSKTKK